MKKPISLSLLILFVSCNGLNAQVNKQPKDTIPKLLYNFTLDPVSYNYVDSILINAWSKAGYPLLKPDADKLQSGLAQLINFFGQEARRQDSIYLLKIKK